MPTLMIILHVAENREALWLNVWLVGLVLDGDVRLRWRQCWTAGSTRMAQNAQKSHLVRHFLGRMSQYSAFGNGVDFMEKGGKHQRQVFLLRADGLTGWCNTAWMVEYRACIVKCNLDCRIRPLKCDGI